MKKSFTPTSGIISLQFCFALQRDIVGPEAFLFNCSLAFPSADTLGGPCLKCMKLLMASLFLVVSTKLALTLANF